MIDCQNETLLGTPITVRDHKQITQGKVSVCNSRKRAEEAIPDYKEIIVFYLVDFLRMVLGNILVKSMA